MPSHFFDALEPPSSLPKATPNGMGIGNVGVMISLLEPSEAYGVNFGVRSLLSFALQKVG